MEDSKETDIYEKEHKIRDQLKDEKNMSNLLKCY